MKVLLIISSLFLCYVAVTSVNNADHRKCNRGKECISKIQFRYDKYRSDRLKAEKGHTECKLKIYGSDKKCVTENLKYCPEATGKTLETRWTDMKKDVDSCK
uniref:Uncharacterized protein n=1 Tax=Octopus bimaculoides TaxID=37653 RepID=A0A0L8GZ38_OCTBM|eukprot:XP_014776917.1 PREDICTED: uncharacterized protein LOC106873900 [Octopus bimaculoides]